MSWGKPEYKAFINENGRVECDGREFNSGDWVEVHFNDQWHLTRIEFIDGKYCSIDGHDLIGNPVKPSF